MTLLFADGFETGTSAWVSSGGGTAVGTGRFGQGVTLTNTSGYWDTGFPATLGPMIIGFAYKPGSATNGGIASIQNIPASGMHIGFVRGASGEINVHAGSFGSLGTVIGTTAAGILPPGAWSYIEMKFTIHASAGIVVLRVNGVEVLNVSGKDTQDTPAPLTASILHLGNTALAGIVSSVYDDVYICDGTGSFNNDFLGEVMIEHLMPGSDDTAQWVGSDGNSVNNWDLVNETGTFNTTDYVATSTVNDRDLYVPVASSRSASSPVKGVIVSAIAQKTDAGTRTARLVIKEGAGGTVRTSTAMGLPTTYGELRAMWDRKADGSTWTVADVNALRFGIEVAT
jgi:hypothetical protein